MGFLCLQVPLSVSLGKIAAGIAAAGGDEVGFEMISSDADVLALKQRFPVCEESYGILFGMDAM